MMAGGNKLQQLLVIVLFCVLCSGGSTTFPGSWWQNGGFLWPPSKVQSGNRSPANTKALPAEPQYNRAFQQTFGGIQLENHSSEQVKLSPEESPPQEVFADDGGGGSELKGVTDPPANPPPSESKAGRFGRGAVVVDSVPCAPVGKEFLLKGGTAVDAALAVLFCNGVVTSESMGIGGGFL